MTASASKLCERCNEFDIRATYVAASNAKLRPIDHWAPASQHDQKLRRDGLSRYFKIHDGLPSLVASAEKCSLCAAICKQFIRLRQGEELSEEELKSDVSTQPIYLDVDEWEPGRSRAPHIIATQFSPERPGYESYGRRLAYFEPCVAPGNEPPDDPMSDVLGRLQASSAADRECLELARAWVTQCTEEHVICNRVPASTSLPTRVLDVLSEPGKMRLVDGKAYKGPYAALSYCWGASSNFTLTADTQKALRDGMDIAVFPATIRDAFKVTQSLDIRFLWVDALCILQDSAEDWAAEASRMSEVYRGSLVTIEAASASTCTDAFLELRSSSQPYVELRWQSDAGAQTQVQLRPIQDITDTQLTYTRLYTRGWTLQERLLAPRTLSFGEQQISFECAAGYRDETGSVSELPRGTEHYLRKQTMSKIRSEQRLLWYLLRWTGLSLGLSPTIKTRWGEFHTQGQVQVSRFVHGSFFDFWRKLIEQFTDRELTFVTDRLPALSGLAREFQQVTADTYCAGMWRSELLFSLRWIVSNLVNLNGDSVKTAGPNGVRASTLLSGWPTSLKSSTYRAPSWSWASVRGPVHFLMPDDMTPTYVPLAEIVKVVCKPRHNDPYGSLGSAYLDIEGPLLRIFNPLVPCEDEYELSALHIYLREGLVLMSDDRASEVFQHHEGHPGQEFALLQLLSWKSGHGGQGNKTEQISSLLLETCGDGTWRRLSLLAIDVNGFFNSVEEMDRVEKMVVLKQQFSTFNRNPMAENARRRQEVARQFTTASWRRELIRIV